MNYQELRNFLTMKMRMSHIYQPVMIRCLLKNRGQAADTTIARDLLLYDPVQLEYYREITNRMVGKVLRGHKIVFRNKEQYTLPTYDSLSQEQITDLIEI